VARAALDGQARLVAERDRRLSELAGEVAALRTRHEEARAACAEAESRCAKADEAVGRLEQATQRLREDHAETLRVVREEAAATLSAVRSEGQRTAERLRSVEEEFSRLGAAHAALERERAERDASHGREVARLREIRKEMTDEFRSLATATLRETGQEFSQAHQDRLKELLTPFREQVNRFEAELREVHSTAKVDRELLGAQLRELTTRTEMVSQEAVNLTRALKGDKQRQGAWGEAQLERYLEHMGYVRDVDYMVQSTRTGDEGDRLRPDVILRMPGGRALVIDSKVSLVSYPRPATDAEARRSATAACGSMRATCATASTSCAAGLPGWGGRWMGAPFHAHRGGVSAAWAHDGDIAAMPWRGVGLAIRPAPHGAASRRSTLERRERNSNAEASPTGGRLYDNWWLSKASGVGARSEEPQGARQGAGAAQDRGNGNLIEQVRCSRPGRADRQDAGSFRRGRGRGDAHHRAAWARRRGARAHASGRGRFPRSSARGLPIRPGLSYAAGARPLGDPDALPVLRKRRHPGEGLASGRGPCLDPAAAVLPGLWGALHHL
jgi:DNA recombination protein RmuC